MTIVLDASMALAWLFGRVDEEEALQARKAARSVGDEGSLVPALWFPEVTNGLLVAERRRVVTAQQMAAFQANLDELDIMMDPASPRSLQPRVLALGRDANLTAYDATYLELAIRNNAQLATFDRKLAEAARTAGVKVFGDPD